MTATLALTTGIKAALLGTTGIAAKIGERCAWMQHVGAPSLPSVSFQGAGQKEYTGQIGGVACWDYLWTFDVAAATPREAAEVADLIAQRMDHQPIEVDSDLGRVAYSAAVSQAPLPVPEGEPARHLVTTRMKAYLTA